MNKFSGNFFFTKTVRVRTHFLLWVSALVALVFCMPAAHAIDAGMPNPPAEPTIVKCGLFVLDIVDSDDVNETFEARTTRFGLRVLCGQFIIQWFLINQ